MNFTGLEVVSVQRMSVEWAKNSSSETVELALVKASINYARRN